MIKIARIAVTLGSAFTLGAQALAGQVSGSKMITIYVNDLAWLPIAGIHLEPDLALSQEDCPGAKGPNLPILSWWCWLVSTSDCLLKSRFRGHRYCSTGVQPTRKDRSDAAGR